MIEVYVSFLTRMISSIVPKKKYQWVFGAWFGTSISDNPKVLMDYLNTQYSEINFVWELNEGIDVPERQPNITYVRRNSLKGIWLAMRSKVAVMNQSYEDICTYNVIGGAYKVQLWHGVAWKKIGEDAKDDPSGILKKLHRKNYLRLNCNDLYIASSESQKEKVCSAFGIKNFKIMSVGQPRNEMFLRGDHEKLRQKYLASWELDSNTKIITYMPTFRDKNNKSFSFESMIGNKEFENFLKYNDCIIVEKSHFVDIKRNNESKYAEFAWLHRVSYIDSQELLAISDILITDYSSCFFDYLLTDRPIIHYLYDYEWYRDKDRGLYYDVEEVTAGSVAYTKEGLILAIVKNVQQKELYQERRKQMKKKFMEYESINNSERIYERIINDIY